ncbi:MarR family winged helix-turn-helix transcriptional regulator [Marinomonas algicola]|uniref:MarR family winged helix-turn-helix transcriptional regulator n=1 Tax=Marinomonas algicola TaxID=2773454 RepID=UPI00174DA556|nr:MarR family transcriptional regulator [Marinomonas algicola]
MTKKRITTKNNQLDLDRYVPALVTFLANKLSSGASACYRKNFDVGVVEWRLLALLKVEQNITANRMCQVIGLDKAAVSRALKLLSQRGSVNFIKDEKDGRSSLICLTKEGEILHDKILHIALEREALLLGGFQAEEVEVLLRLLHKLNANIGQVNAFDPNGPVSTQD